MSSGRANPQARGTDGRGARESGSIARKIPTGPPEAEVLFRLALAALLPAVVVLPVRILAFRDESPFTILLLGPTLEESLKLSSVLLAVMGAAVYLPRGRDPATALRYWLFLAPWFVGGLYGMTEGILVYGSEAGVQVTLRELAHGTFAALALTGVLWIWRDFRAPYAALLFGLGAAWVPHFFFNLLALESDALNVSFLDQVLYTLAACVVAAIFLGRAVAREPASRETRRFLALRARARTRR